ncbi:hypothetical protein HK104_003922 [Borealophlyctis nickersoniae]|nr:hypothetical protein HK104_003922 [Borealophlyctis nickersoniae]
MTGPGVPFTPSMFQQAGWFVPVLMFIVFLFVSTLSVLFIIEAMQAIPGNKHFQGTVEFATLINFYFGKWAHIFGQILLYGAIQSQAIQCIIISAQTFDNILIDIFGKSCGLALSGDHLGWYCVSQGSTSMPSPFGDTWMLFTLGIVVVLLISIPMGMLNLDDNVGIQIGVLAISSIIALEWIGAAIVNGLQTSRVPAIGQPSGFAQVVGPVMLNMAFTTVVPSWVNIKNRDVNTSTVVWGSTSFVAAFNIILGVFLALGFDIDPVSQNVLTALLASNKVNKAFAYGFTLVMLLPAIPVAFIVSKSNLVQNEIAGRRMGVFLAEILPWLMCIPLQTGTYLKPFLTWTSLIFVSSANFAIPLIIYLKCLKFRRAYNADRELTEKQRVLLKSIHSLSRTIKDFIDSRGESAQPPRKSVRRSLPPPSLAPDTDDASGAPAGSGTTPGIVVTELRSADAEQGIAANIAAGMALVDAEEQGRLQTMNSDRSNDSLTVPSGDKRRGSAGSSGRKSVTVSIPHHRDEDTESEGEEGHGGPDSPPAPLEKRPSWTSVVHFGEGVIGADAEDEDHRQRLNPPGRADEESYLNEDVPDPDLEHIIARRQTDAERGLWRRGSTASGWRRDSARRESSVSGQEGDTGSRSGSRRPSAQPETLKLEEVKLGSEQTIVGPDTTTTDPTNKTTPPTSSPSLGRHSTSGRSRTSSVRTSGTGPHDEDDDYISMSPDIMSRRQTLPANRIWTSPVTFRSIPTWFPVRGHTIAWTLLVVTGVVGVGNIVVTAAA